MADVCVLSTVHHFDFASVLLFSFDITATCKAREDIFSLSPTEDQVDLEASEKRP